MYISNINNIKTRTYKCGRVIGKYLIKQGVPLLSQTNGIMIFSNNKKLREVLNKMPLTLKLLMKGGIING